MMSIISILRLVIYFVVLIQQTQVSSSSSPRNSVDIINPSSFSTLYDGSCHVVACVDVDDIGEKLVRKISTQLRDDECRPGLLECNKKLRSSKKTWLEKFDVKSSKKTTLLLFNNVRLQSLAYRFTRSLTKKKQQGEATGIIPRKEFKNKEGKISPKKLLNYVRKMDKPVSLAMIRSQADLDEKCTSRKYCMIVLAKPDSNTTSLLSKSIKTRLKRLGKIFRNVRFVVVDLTKFSADFPDWIGTSRPDPVLDESDGGRKLWPVFVNRISKSKRRELEIVDVPPAVNPSSLSLHTDTKIRLSTCRNQIRDVLLRGGTWCSSAKRENFNNFSLSCFCYVNQITRISLVSLTNAVQEYRLKIDARMHTR